jgi:hypothetical protein
MRRDRSWPRSNLAIPAPFGRRRNPAPPNDRKGRQAKCGVLKLDPRAETQYRVLDRTYLRPAPSQEKAADLPDLPFSTYRRYRDRGIEAITDWLWDRDIVSTSRA